MRSTHTILALALLAAAAPAQFVPPPVLENPTSQANCPDAALVIHMRTRVNGLPVTPNLEVMGPSSKSITATWVVDPVNLPNAVLDLQATIYSMPQAPFTLAISEAPGPFPCCTFGTWLPGLVSFPRMGKYHLGQTPVPVIDGLGVFGGASSLAVANSGSIQLFGSLPLNSPDHITIQALVPDATSSVGVSFTAAFASVKFQ